MKKIDIKPVKVNLSQGKPLAPAVNLKETINQQPAPDPLADVDYTGDMEEDARRETDALLDSFRERARQEQDRFTLATDSEFWVAIGFKSRAQKEFFLQALDWLQFGDKYIDGTAIAAALGIVLPAVELRDPTKRQDRKLQELT